MEDALHSCQDETKWSELLEQQTALFHKTVAANKVLSARVDELEREVGVWKLGLKNSDDEKSALQKEAEKLNRTISSFKDDNTLVLGLVDGDGCIFAQEHLALGHLGGKQAASQLTKGITEYLASQPTDSAGRATIYIHIFLNKTGLSETLRDNNQCTPEQFEAFLNGFNQASPLFNITDVGSGKEAADSKIKQMLRVFAPFPQIPYIFFGGAHDNGYTSTLNEIQNTGLLDKIVVLQSYRTIATEIRALNIPSIEIPSVFMRDKLTTQDRKYFATRSPRSPKTLPAPSLPSFSRSESPVTRRNIDPSLPLSKQKPVPCNYFYLTRCKTGPTCRFAHDYILTRDQVVELRRLAKTQPCGHRNRNQKCKVVECIFGHFCPQGPGCEAHVAGRCHFIG
ncbi:hypothetical protein SISNIDRAFT_550014, partial [Sistotremastrum niveocremeum HHB9708]